MITDYKRRLLRNPKALGKWGEKHCEKFLKRKGFRKLAHNFACKAGEIDLITVASDGTIVFVEVKTRAGEAFAPAEDVVTSAKKSKLIRAAKYFLQAHGIEGRPLRFDVVTIVFGPTGSAHVRHYENAFAL